ncbi:hypothetical protein M569_01732 [Genlisea aurea]|uniref:protein-tyrosine-phosphatase n=1 Tax=Genlisea aurea TaxID=192259 RepID=S8EK96_9LAMI|nr:hypothetical protein M569_01732 [Genlisea aurea]
MDQKLNVYIWDMDETLILLKSLLNGAYAEASNDTKDAEHGIKLGKLWENHILKVCDKHFFYEQIENFNQPYLDVLSEYDDGLDLSSYNFDQDGFGMPMDCIINKRRLAYRHRIIGEKYSKGLHNILNRDLIKLWDSLYELTDSYTDKWLSSARACLSQCSEFEKNVNILVTSGPLIPSLAKCLLYRLDDTIPHENVYSSLEVGKLQCFSWIKERFSGRDARFCVVGDGWEECEGAESMKWPFVRIDIRPGSVCRFPGLTCEDLRHYFNVVYGTEEGNGLTSEATPEGNQVR